MGRGALQIAVRTKVVLWPGGHEQSPYISVLDPCGLNFIVRASPWFRSSGGRDGKSRFVCG